MRCRILTPSSPGTLTSREWNGPIHLFVPGQRIAGVARDHEFGFDLTPATAAGALANTPFIQFGNDINFPSIGVDSNFPQTNNQTVWQIQEALSYSANRHTIKAGIDITRVDLSSLLALINAEISFTTKAVDSAALETTSTTLRAKLREPSAWVSAIQTSKARQTCSRPTLKTPGESETISR